MNEWLWWMNEGRMHICILSICNGMCVCVPGAVQAWNASRRAHGWWWCMLCQYFQEPIIWIKWVDLSGYHFQIFDWCSPRIAAPISTGMVTFSQRITVMLWKGLGSSSVSCPRNSPRSRVICNFRMDIKVPPGESLTKEQKTEMAKGFEFLGLMAEGGRARKRKGLPLIVPKSEVPKLLRGCGRTPTAADLKELMANVPDEGRLGAFSY